MEGMVQNLLEIFINKCRHLSVNVELINVPIPKTMLSKLFNNSVSEEQQQKIRQFYANYQCDIFPQGIELSTKLAGISKEKSKICLTIDVPFACDGALDRFASALLDETDISVLVISEVNVLPVRRHKIAGIKNILAISSGKGGVGKSTTAVNLAFALQEEGANVGILDADVYGPSIPKMLGVEGKKVTSHDGKVMLPIERDGISAMSIGLLTDEKDATVWRGPMASRAFNQMLNETAWDNIDYLIVDMPPGTGDIQLTLAQQVPVAAAIIITTPQDIALADATKGISMFNQVNVPVLGVIENMSYHVCEHCGESSHLFGEGGGKRLSKEFSTPLLGQLPLDIAICEFADKGKSMVIENSASDIASQYRRIAGKITASLYQQRDSLSPKGNEIDIKQVD